MRVEKFFTLNHTLRSLYSWMELFIWIFREKRQKSLGVHEIRYSLELYIHLKRYDKSSLDASEKIAKHLFKRLRPRESPLKIVRIGQNADSGYCVAKLKKVDMVVSGGAGKNIDFEVWFADLNATVHICDPSVKRLPKNHIKISHHKFYLGNSKNSNNWINLMNFENKIKFEKSNTNLLKLDIEGSELELLGEEDINLQFYDQIVIEIHNLFKITSINYQKKLLKLVDNLLKHHHVIVFNTNNNGLILNYGQCFIPEVFELTLLNKKFFSNKAPGVTKYSTFMQRYNNNPNRLKVPNIYRILS
jgi:hypothetical protein